MVEIKAIAALFLAYILIGVSITGLIQASVYTVTCGFCQDGIKSVADDFTALVRAGQKNIDENSAVRKEEGRDRFAAVESRIVR